MKFKTISILVLALVAALVATASANSGTTLSGSLFGMATQNNIDLTGDGANGRSGMLRARGFGLAYADVNLDSEVDLVNPQGVCPAGETQIHAQGQIVFSSLSGNNVIVTIIDTSAPICFGGPAEEVGLTIIDGRGAYAGATGTGAVFLSDDIVLGVDPAFPFSVPSVVYVHDGQYTLSVD